VSTPAHGTAAIRTNGTIGYTPAANFNGVDRFTYTISDGHGGSATGAVTVTVTAVNDAPVATDDAATTDENAPVTIAVQANDTDVDGDVLSVIAVTKPAHGSAAINPDGTVTYAPAAKFNGLDSFVYTISDGHGGTAAASVFVTITPVNDPPVAANDSYSTKEDTLLTIDAPGVIGNDTDVDSTTLTV